MCNTESSNQIPNTKISTFSFKMKIVIFHYTLLSCFKYFLLVTTFSFLPKKWQEQIVFWLLVGNKKTNSSKRGLVGSENRRCWRYGSIEVLLQFLTPFSYSETFPSFTETDSNFKSLTECQISVHWQMQHYHGMNSGEVFKYCKSLSPLNIWLSGYSTASLLCKGVW